MDRGIPTEDGEVPEDPCPAQQSSSCMRSSAFGRLQQVHIFLQGLETLII